MLNWLRKDLGRGRSRRCFLFQTIHPFNLPLAWLCAIAGRVAYWRTESVPVALLNGLSAMDPEALFSLDEWQDETLKAFRSWSDAKPHERDATVFTQTLVGQKIDLSVHLLQWLAIRYEERKIFFSLSDKWCKSNSVASKVTIIRRHHDKMFAAIGLDSFPLQEENKSDLATWLDLGWLSYLALRETLKQLAMLVGQRGGTEIAQNPIVFAGISAGEMPTDDKKLDFAFLVARGLLASDRCLFLLPQKPDAARVARFGRLKLQWLRYGSFAFLPLINRLAIVINICRLIFVLGVFCRSIFGPVRLAFALQALPWVHFARYVHPRGYVATISASWPEAVEVSVMKSLGIPTVNWSYGGNGFRFSKANEAFEDVNLIGSYAESDEVWVWTEEVKRWLAARQMGRQPKIKVIGPVMAGDARWLSLAPAAARAKFGISERSGDVFMSVFDVPTFSRQFRMRAGLGPTTAPLEMLEKFYEDLLHALAKIPRLRLILKPKRSLHDPRRNYPDSLKRLLDFGGSPNEANRIVLVDHAIDPYIPISLADVCVGIPFTSPILAAKFSGRVGIYYDPMDQIRFYYPDQMNPLLSHDSKDLFKRLSSPMQFEPGKYIDPQIPFAQHLADFTKKV